MSFWKKGIALALAVAMVLPIAACKDKKTKNSANGSESQSVQSTGEKKVISEDDPFFSNAEAKLDLTSLLDSEKEISQQYMKEPLLLGDRVIAEYGVSYQYTKDFKERLDRFYENAESEADFDSPEFKALQKEEMEYSDGGLVMFDLNGQVLKKIDFAENEEPYRCMHGEDGEIYLMYASIDVDNRDESYSIARITREGEVKDQHPLDIDLYSFSNPSFHVLSNGNLLCCGTEMMQLFDAAGKPVQSQKIRGFYGDVFYTNEDHYIALEHFDEKTGMTRMSIVNDSAIALSKLSLKMKSTWLRLNGGMRKMAPLR